MHFNKINCIFVIFFIRCSISFERWKSISRIDQSTCFSEFHFVSHVYLYIIIYIVAYKVNYRNYEFVKITLSSVCRRFAHVEWRDKKKGPCAAREIPTRRIPYLARRRHFAFQRTARRTTNALRHQGDSDRGFSVKKRNKTR